MNRLQPFASFAETAPIARVDEVADLSSAQYAVVGGDAPTTLFAPLHYERNYAYPLLVWLHGPGDDERQLKRIMPLISMRNYIGVGVRGVRRAQAGVGTEGYTWTQSHADVSLAEQRVFDAIEMAGRKFHLSPGRIFLAGFDCGGSMAFRLAMSHPRLFAGVLSLGGRFPTGRTPLSQLADARRLPLFLACGRYSETYPPSEVCENLKLFHSAGLQVALRQYPCAQDVDSLMLADMDRWMMEQITGVNQSAPC